MAASVACDGRHGLAVVGCHHWLVVWLGVYEVLIRLSGKRYVKDGPWWRDQYRVAGVMDMLSYVGFKNLPIGAALFLAIKTLVGLAMKHRTLPPLALLALAASLLSQPASAATVRVQAGQIRRPPCKPPPLATQWRWNGFYRVNLRIDKALTLRGVGRPTLSGGQVGDTIRVTAPDGCWKV